ncbi:MAG: hypothetical protein Q9169_007712 [Polycauliona sp. 2 TL-2023]
MTPLPTPGSAVKHGLGTLSRLPPDIREQVWEEHFRDPSIRLPTDEAAQQLYSGQCDGSNRGSLVKQSPQAMAILRTSKQLYGEVSEIFYRHRVLALCGVDRAIPLFRLNPEREPITLPIHSDGLSHYKDLSGADFSIFKSIIIVMGCSCAGRAASSLQCLKVHVHKLRCLLESWQMRKLVYFPGCPDIHIVLPTDLVPTTVSDDGLVPFYREFASIFGELENTQGIKTVTFHGLPHDEVILCVVQDVVDKIKKPGMSFPSKYVAKFLHIQINNFTPRILPPPERAVLGMIWVTIGLVLFAERVVGRSAGTYGLMLLAWAYVSLDVVYFFETIAKSPRRD